MKISLEWIQKYVDLPQDLSMEDLSRDLTMRTVEVEGYEALKKTYDHVVVGVITALSPHPDADLLHVTKVDVGEEELQIVCGGVNLYVGQKVVVTLPGAYAVWHGEGEPVKIDVTELRGVRSHGMICGANELGLETLFPARVPHEIIDLKDFEAPAGTPLVEALALDDTILEIDNKSLTNRPDLWGHYGMAREFAAIYEKSLRPLPEPQPLPETQYPVTVQSDRCPRYTAMVWEGVDARPAPYWMRAALMKAGVRPINALIDITNYVMLATGQPTHAFDRNHIQGGIIVRLAHPEESLELLDGTICSLSPEDLVIADHEKPVALAGVMGGAKDSIGEDTQAIVFEIAGFSAKSIRKTAQRYGIRTESSMRFEKGIDLPRIAQAQGLAQALLSEIFPQARCIAAGADGISAQDEVTIDVTSGWLSRRLGLSVTDKDVAERLAPLGFSVERSGEGLHIHVPSWRATGDVSLPDDVLEEVARMIGYENFPVYYPDVQLKDAVRQPKVELDRALREYLAFRCGFQEIFTYPWVNETFIQAAGIDTEKALTLAQPPAPEERFLRVSLVPGVLQAVQENVRYLTNFRIFELTQVFEKADLPLPRQRRFLSGALVGADAKALFYEAKGVLESMSRLCQMEALRLAELPAELAPAWADRKASLGIFCEERCIGTLGLLAPWSRAVAGIKFQEAALFELDVEALRPLDSRTNHYEKLPLYPHVQQDLSVLVDRTVAWSTVAARLSALAKSVRFVDEYTGPQIPADKKSLTLRVELASDTGTLTNEEVEKRMAVIREAMAEFGARLRDR